MKYIIFLIFLLPSIDWDDTNPIVTRSFQDIKPIFERSCVRCHNQEGKNWTIYKDAFEYRYEIRYRVWVNKSMPLDFNITDKERLMIKDLVDSGFKEF